MRTLNEEVYKILINEFGEDRVHIFCMLAERYHSLRGGAVEEDDIRHREEYDYVFWGLKKDYLNLKKEYESRENKGDI